MKTKIHTFRQADTAHCLQTQSADHTQLLVS